MKAYARSFIALLPYHKRLSGDRVLKDLRDELPTESSSKYAVDGIKRFKRKGIAEFNLQLTYRESQETELSERRPQWRLDPSIEPVLDYMFGTRIKGELSDFGLLKLSFPADSSILPKDEDLLLTELEGHVFHFAKLIARVLQSKSLIPRDFEYKRSVTFMSENPTTDLVARFENIFADVHRETNELGIESFKDVSELVGTWPRRLFQIATLFSTSTPDYRNLRRVALVGRSLLRWRYWLIWHCACGVDGFRQEVEDRLSSRYRAASLDLRDMERQADRFHQLETSISTYTGILISVFGAGLGSMLAAQSESVTWTIAVVEVLVLSVLMKLLMETASGMRIDAETLTDVFRWDHSAHPADEP